MVWVTAYETLQLLVLQQKQYARRRLPRRGHLIGAPLVVCAESVTSATARYP